ncbi:hypothetical protein [Ideonella sp. BN130291]|uniref:hypothetical protein n=1 Tax=Ideonella sp. BN130291 TaxID=3112940 RepID=UPI002E2555C3|nr:hypothetical protein [Ideonella sp. BN130291]
MAQENSPHSLHVPLFQSLDAIGFGEHGNIRHFDTGTLFWSLTRLFGCYERVFLALAMSREDRLFLDADLEHYIIRFRIVMNDVAFVIRQIMPSSLRGFKGLTGGVHPKNREMSVFTLAQYLSKNSDSFPEFAEAFASASKWMARLANDRDNVVHYKSKVVVFETPIPSFALVNAAGTERSEPTADGRSQMALTQISEFVNSQMLALHRFMHEDLATAVTSYASRVGLKSIQAGHNHRISCIGIQRFRSINAIAA